MRLSPLEIARHVLEKNKQPLHVDDIALMAVELGLAANDDLGVLPARLANALSQNLKSREPFVKKPSNGRGGTKKGYYALKTKRVTESQKHKQIALDPLPDLSTQYIGAAGEHAVYAELLFRGYNASIMSVDDGIDVVASKDNRFFHIQVKTSNESANGYVYSIRKSIFDAHKNGLTFYILVIRRVLNNRYICDFAVLPSSYLLRLIGLGIISDSNTYSLRLKIDQDGRYILNGREDITPHVNNFSQIA